MKVLSSNGLSDPEQNGIVVLALGAKLESFFDLHGGEKGGELGEGKAM